MQAMPRRLLVLPLLCLVAAQGPGGPDARAGSSPANDLVVHEWGTFTTIADDKGAMLEWRPLSGSSDLPGFVYSIDGLAEGIGLRNGVPAQDGKSKLRATVRMETPVLYFYTERAQEVSVDVMLRGGTITEWYPRARAVGGRIDWGPVLLQPRAGVALPREPARSHYYPARATDAVPLRVSSSLGEADEHEKFLFYRGVGSFDLPVRVTRGPDGVRVANIGREQITQCVVFENDGGKLRYDIHCYLDGGKSVTLRPTKESSLDALLGDLTKILRGQGLFEKEARSMIATWRDEWFDRGERVFYTVPRAHTDRVLPLRVRPKPKDCVRVLVGRVELLTPAFETELRREVAKLLTLTGTTRARAAARLDALGRFAEPLLERLLAASSDEDEKEAIRLLLRAGSEEERDRRGG